MGERAFAIPEEVEAAFYRAFEAADLAAMMRVWEDSDEVACIHPGGPRLRGVAAVRLSFETLFAQGPPMHFRIEELQSVAEGEIAVHVLHERVRIGRDVEYQRPLIATNAYRRGADGWRMILHHASPSPQVQRATRAQVH